MLIRPFQPADQDAVIALWDACGLLRPWNDPARDIERKLTVQPELFLVADAGGPIVGSAMGGYDGHRGSVYYLAVDATVRGTGLARRLMGKLERRLTEMGCPKLNLMVRSTNDEVLGFYDALGYGTDAVVVRSRRLIADA